MRDERLEQNWSLYSSDLEENSSKLKKQHNNNNEQLWPRSRNPSDPPSSVQLSSSELSSALGSSWVAPPDAPSHSPLSCYLPAMARGQGQTPLAGTHSFPDQARKAGGRMQMF